MRAFGFMTRYMRGIWLGITRNTWAFYRDICNIGQNMWAFYMKRGHFITPKES